MGGQRRHARAPLPVRFSATPSSVLAQHVEAGLCALDGCLTVRFLRSSIPSVRLLGIPPPHTVTGLLFVPPVVTPTAEQLQLEEELMAEIGVRRVVHVVAAVATPLAPAVLALDHLGARALPLLGCQVLVIPLSPRSHRSPFLSHPGGCS